MELEVTLVSATAADIWDHLNQDSNRKDIADPLSQGNNQEEVTLRAEVVMSAEMEDIWDHLSRGNNLEEVESAEELLQEECTSKVERKV